MSGAPDGSVTLWIVDLKGGDSGAASQLWERYFHRIVGLARAKLGQSSRIAADADEEDIALSVFSALCKGAAEGRFEQLRDRDDLWRLLVVITARKAADQRKRQGRLRRGQGRVIVESDLPADASGVFPAVLEQIVANDPTPEFAVMLAEEFERRFEHLGDETLRRIALLRLAGYTSAEIAEQLNCARRTVARRLDMIRQIWSAA
jgi:RNA polymerase sigma factor (sigma-70 family)